ncbi:MAG: hypothetical protein J6C92_04500 [Bacteroidaceae bacterium]|nr:hypothetical protein [Bacteroidaceae bacterium]
MGYKQSQERKRRLVKLYEETKNTYGRGAYYDKRKKRLIRYTVRQNANLPRFYRKRANRAVRRNKAEILNHGGYRKQYDYWWELF